MTSTSTYTPEQLNRLADEREKYGDTREALELRQKAAKLAKIRDAGDEGMTVYGIPAQTADRMLELAGLEKEANGRYGGRYWEKEEAVRAAIITVADSFR